MEDIHLGYIEEIDLEMFNFDDGFEPMTRSRSNTWPAPRPERQPADGSSRKKKPPRKNPWGDLSYADLISQAINSSQDRRLTLSQIYDWMVQNISYFKDKSESKSSAGWKNSIRHNLSLHNRFIRIPNEAQGKSSWWTINPDVRSEKTTRRRSASMEAGKLEKKRALAKKQADSIRKKLLKNEIFTTPNECIDNDVQSSITNRHLQTCFRPRASSCASSYGRLSTIPQEPDWTEIECPELLLQSSIPPVNQVAQTQECLPMNDQTFFTSQNLTDAANFCLLHPLESCNCNNSAEINNEIATSSSQDNFVITDDSHTFYTLQNIHYINSAPMPQTGLLHHKEGSDVNYNNYTIIDRINQATEMFVLPRNNSMLDDINEIIKKDQNVEIEKVNDSMSTALFIGNNNNIESNIIY